MTTGGEEDGVFADWMDCQEFDDTRDSLTRRPFDATHDDAMKTN
jgi:hypothetical protein